MVDEDFHCTDTAEERSQLKERNKTIRSTSPERKEEVDFERKNKGSSVSQELRDERRYRKTILRKEEKRRGPAGGRELLEGRAYMSSVI